ncbi:alanine racemase [Desulfobacter curvatus]|uniref:alanine racemase n=1 Tax=Desulfobacter curvatus TaxID=2290 RepID=UPI00037C75C9|nr:alanine racemase [Desulfobacter curvatus]
MEITDHMYDVAADIPTPCLIIDENRLEKNIGRIHDYAARHSFMVRPHVKTHKCIYITRMQMAAGAKGIAVAKAGEALALAENPGTDITVAYPVLGKQQIKMIADMAARHTIRVAVDSRHLMACLSKAAQANQTRIGIHIIFDAGLHRCGTSDPEDVVALARYATKAPGLHYEGVQLYLGHLYGDAARDPAHFRQINTLWDPTYKALCRAGLTPETVSSGSSPSLFNTHLVNHVNEIRVGTMYLNDYFELKFNHCEILDCAARVVATVISDRVEGQVIIDAGSKALCAKQLLAGKNLEMGYVCEYPEAKIFRLHEEHGWVDVSQCKKPPSLGQRISIIPVNIALCMNLFNVFFLAGKDGSLRREPIQARGCCV